MSDSVKAFVVTFKFMTGAMVDVVVVDVVGMLVKYSFDEVVNLTGSLID